MNQQRLCIRVQLCSLTDFHCSLHVSLTLMIEMFVSVKFKLTRTLEIPECIEKYFSEVPLGDLTKVCSLGLICK